MQDHRLALHIPSVVPDLVRHQWHQWLQCHPNACNQFYNSTQASPLCKGLACTTTSRQCTQLHQIVLWLLSWPNHELMCPYPR
jgi:hypothetical protein